MSPVSHLYIFQVLAYRIEAKTFRSLAVVEGTERACISRA